MLVQVKSSFNVDLLISSLKYDFVFLYLQKKEGLWHIHVNPTSLERILEWSESR